MPYHYVTHEGISQARVSRLTAYSWAPPNETQSNHAPYSYGPDMMEARGGTNSSIRDPAFKLERSNPYLVSKRIFVGYDLVKKYRSRYRYVDGKRQKQTEAFMAKVKVFETVFDVRYRDFKLIPSTRYLMSNYLDFAQSIDIVFPPSAYTLSVSTRDLGAGYVITTYTKVESSGPFTTYCEMEVPVPKERNTDNLNVGNWNHVTVPPYLEPSQLNLDKAVIKLYQKVGDDLPNYYTVAAESGELLSTLRSLAQKALAFAWKIYKLKFKQIWNDLKDINPKDFTDAWLTWVYGLAPVISDIEKSLEVLMRSTRAWRTFSASVDCGSEIINVPGYLGPHGSVEEHHTNFLRLGVTIDAYMSMVKYTRRLTNWEQPTGTLYELIPFSFMLDWLVDISGYLNNCFLLDGNIIDSWKTTGRISETIEKGHAGISKGSEPWAQEVHTLVASPPTLTRVAKKVRVVRERYILPPMPKPIVPPASQLFDGISLQRGINALAIAVSRLYGIEDRWSRSYNRDLRKINLNLRGQ